MADVPVEAAANANNWKACSRPMVFTTKDIGYHFFVDAGTDLIYRKTTDGGGTWGSPVIVRTGTINCFDVWYDKWTPGNTGTLIHIVYQDSALTDILYRNLDTASSDVLNPTVASSAGGTQVANGASYLTILGGWDDRFLSITRARGGNLYVSSNPDTFAEAGLYRSTDVGVNWTSRTFSFATNKIYMLLPANTSDPQDVASININTASSVAVQIHVIDDSANTTFATSASFNAIGSVSYWQMAASIRHSDNHIIFATWTQLDNALASLKTADLDPASAATNGTTIVNKTDVITTTAEYAQCCVYINQNNNDLYVGYLGGSTWATNAEVYYKKSTDGGTTWGTQTRVDVTLDDSRAIWSDLGGTNSRFIPAWQNDDLDDIYVNKDNSVEIVAAAGGRTTKNTKPRPLGIFAGMGRRQVGVPL